MNTPQPKPATAHLANQHHIITTAAGVWGLTIEL